MVDDEPGSGGGEQYVQLVHGEGGDEQLLQLGLGGVGADQHSQLEHGVGGDASQHSHLGHGEVAGLVLVDSLNSYFFSCRNSLYRMFYKSGPFVDSLYSCIS